MKIMTSQEQNFEEIITGLSNPEMDEADNIQ